MKTISLIPKKVRDTYKISKYKNSVVISDPASVHVYLDESFEIINGETTLDIRNDKCVVFLWKDVKIMHVTIY